MTKQPVDSGVHDTYVMAPAGAVERRPAV